ncbi:metallopeptidase [Nocardioides psychrotolerans]|uniref:Aminopeptidase N n=1 Tax=Nocardioides psychrotolerans TaxID=1005945 RepID=A0A1I3E9U5_9ACTN|nr:M1 family metallopeptidase [Nocardioides psychrotolerans]GEP37459.1 metallopeptidase [Nocardioides psychrotolerans]SFH95623.1 Peptidase family M1 [Nocardioides psychrotolerans]
MRRHLTAIACASALALTACSSAADPASAPAPSSAPSPETALPPASPAYDIAVSEPVEDSVYPEVGDPSVDALHYDLDLTWDPEASVLTGEQSLTFRATATAEQFQLDLGAPLEVTEVTLDDEPVDFEHDGKDLVVTAPVTADERYVLGVAYAGTPEAVPAPTMRGDFSDTGFTITETGETWTMQEPYGAYTWYAVNDQPADKALYDFELTVPSPWVGVANGELTDRREDDDLTTTTWHLAEPAAAYLTTVAFGDFEMTEDVSASGVPITYWVHRDAPAHVMRGLRTTPAAIAWLEEKLGPYPFDTFGTVVVDSESGMETQTMVTLGDTDYTTSPAVVLHELAHHWYGDTVTPDDWRDVWMNEGMAMYLQGMWQADQDGRPVGAIMDEWARFEDDERAIAGPPAAYDPQSFGSGNIYYGPALMWHELRQQIGDDEFFRIMRAWPEERTNGSAGRDDYLPWLEEQTGEELSAFFDSWLLGEQTPPRA